METEPTITVDDCIKLIKSDLPEADVQKYLREEFSKPHNFETYCRFVFPKAFTRPFSKAHKEVIGKYHEFGNDSVALPRNHGKSTLIGLGWVSWRIVNEMNKYIVYTSQNHQKSVSFLEPLRYSFKHNKRLRWLYPDMRASEVKEDGVDRMDMYDIYHTRIHALSFEKNIRGLKNKEARPDLIILDDIEEDERVINPELRLKDEDKLNKQIIPALDSLKGQYKMIGTILHHDSLLKKKINLHGGTIYKAAEGNPTKGWTNILWPEQFPPEKLTAEYKELGSAAFESEYLNNPIDNAKSVIKLEWIEQCYDESLSYGMHQASRYDYNVQGVDFAFADRVDADWSNFMGVGKLREVENDWEGYEIRWCAWEQGLSITEQFDRIEFISGMYKVDNNALEENSVRGMSKDLLQYDFPYTLFWMGASDPSPEQLEKRKELNSRNAQKRFTVGKVNVIKRLAPQFENKRIRLPYKTDADKRITHRLRDELVTFSLKSGKLVETGRHSDAGIALALAIESAEMESFELGTGYA